MSFNLQAAMRYVLKLSPFFQKVFEIFCMHLNDSHAAGGRACDVLETYISCQARATNGKDSRCQSNRESQCALQVSKCQDDKFEDLSKSNLTCDTFLKFPFARSRNRWLKLFEFANRILLQWRLATNFAAKHVS